MQKGTAFDFVMRISTNVVSCFLKETKEQEGFFGENSSLHVPFSLSENVNQNISILQQAIKEAIIQAERKLLQRLERVVLLLDIGFLQKKNIKIEAKNDINFSVIREKIEEKMGNKIITIFYNGVQENFKIFEVLSIPKADMQLILDIVSEVGMEIIEAMPDIKFIAEKTLDVFSLESCLLLKFKNDSMECASVKKGLITKYNVYENFGFNSIFQELEFVLNIPKEILVKLANFYNTTSKIDRLKTYYNREREDFEIKEFIENTTLIANMQNGLKKIMENMILKINPKHEFEQVCFYYAGNMEYTETNNFKLHKFANYFLSSFEFSNFYHSDMETQKASEETVPIVGVVAKRMKNFFHLTS